MSTELHDGVHVHVNRFAGPGDTPGPHRYRYQITTTYDGDRLYIVLTGDGLRELADALDTLDDLACERCGVERTEPHERWCDRDYSNAGSVAS